MARAAMKKKQNSSVIDMAARLSQLAKVGIFLGLGLVMGLVFYLAFYMPYAKERDALNQSLTQLRRDIGTQQTSLKKHQEVAAHRPVIQTAYEYIQQFLPQENEMPRLVQMVSEIGARAGLTDGVTLFRPSLPAQVKENYAEIPFTMNLQGEFLTVLSFLYDFSKMDRIVNITTVNIGSPKMVDPVREVFHIAVTCSGSTYRSLTDAEMEAAAAPAQTRRGRRR